MMKLGLVALAVVALGCEGVASGTIDGPGAGGGEAAGAGGGVGGTGGSVGTGGGVAVGGGAGGSGGGEVSGTGGGVGGAGGTGGTGGTGGGMTVDPCATATLEVPVSPMRRLTNTQLVSSWRDVLNDQAADPKLDPAPNAIVSELQVEKFSTAAEELIARKGHLPYAPCDTAGAGTTACAQGFIEAFGKMAWRRPLEAAEVTSLMARYTSTRTLAGVTPAITFREAIDVVAQVILTSPQMIYVSEFGATAAGKPANIRTLTGFERATRISYLIWNSTPDKALLDAATKGDLNTSTGVRAAADRLMSDPRANQKVRSFASSWLALDTTVRHPGLETNPKNATKFPFDNLALRTAMRTEVEALAESVFFEPGSSFKNLLTTRKAYVNAPLAQLYGVTAGAPTGTAWKWVDLDATQRAGVFTRAAFLTQTANSDYQSPIRRGVHMYRHVLCRVLGDPPANVNDTPVAPTDGAHTVRANTDTKTAGSCQGCHSLVNPIGYTMENYDAMGRWQTTETGTFNGAPYSLPIDSTATVTVKDIDGPLAGPLALAQRLSNSQMAHDCLADQWFFRAFERAPKSSDACLVKQVKDSFRQTSDMKAMVLDLLSSEPALFIQAP